MKKWILAAITSLGVILSGGAVDAAPPLPRLVSHAPSFGATPNVNDVTSNRETIAAYAEAGPNSFYGGYTLSANMPGKPAQSCGHFLWQTYTSRRVGNTPGRSTLSCNIKFNGSIEALVVSPDKRYLYVGGRFTQVRVGNQPFNRTGVAKISIAGRTVTSDFRPTLTKSSGGTLEVLDLRFLRGALLMGGNFTHVNGTTRKALATVTPGTGVLTSYVNLNVSGQFNGSTGVAKVAINPNGTRAMMVGEFTSVAGARRYRAAMLNLNSTRASLSGWYSRRLEQTCGTRTYEYVRDADFSPNGSFVTLATGGGASRVGSLCDTVARYRVDANSNAKPAWQRDSTADTIWSVEDTGAVVYASGHEKGWTRRFINDVLVENKKDLASGISALSASNGKIVRWPAGRDRGDGARELVSLPASSYHPPGLMVGSDTFWWYDRSGRRAYYRGCVALLPML